MHEITFYVCGSCACLISNDDNSGDAFDTDPEWRRAALETALDDRFACMPSVACTDCASECGGHQEDACDVCGRGDDLGDSHRVVADYVGRTYPAR